MSFKDPWYTQALDQLLHALWGAGIGFLPAFYGAPAWACGLSALICILPREFVDQKVYLKWKTSDWWLDVTFFFIGGLIIGCVF